MTSVRAAIVRTPAVSSSLASVAVGRPVRGEFTYVVPAELEGKLVPGLRLLVPFGPRPTLGFYLGPAEPPADEKVRLKPILKVLDETPALTPDLIALLRFAAEHYRYPLGEAIRGAMPPGLSKPDEKEDVAPEVQKFVVASPGADVAVLARAPAQAAALSYLLAVGGRAALDELAAAVPGARETVKKLAQRGLVQVVEEAIQRGVREGLQHGRHAQLTPDQASAVSVLNAAVDEGGFKPFLLHGVTGSGKTEVYLQVLEHARDLGKGGLILVPEIALTPQLVGRVRSRFGAEVAVLHSALKDKDRLRQWQALRRGDVKVAVGVRSAIFAPVKDLAVIVVDEEHEGSFKQEDKLRYQARDLAVVRGKQVGATVVLGSATPSLETLENANRGRYQKLTLRTRVDDRPMPEVELVDLRTERPREPGRADEAPILSPSLVAAIEQTLSRNQQVILFLNRRGHSTFLVCEVCGEALRCESCDVSLTHHLAINKVMCHYCGYSSGVPVHCPQCRGGMLKLGAGTERVEAEVASRFPQARVARLDRDAASSAEKLTELLAAFARREIDILVGTQMVAKGHDFPGVTLVCVVLADTSLALPDFRAAERTFQLLTQVAGRAGRGHDAGRVLVQTYNPEAMPVQRVLGHDFDTFAAEELTWRRAFAYPPFSRMAAIKIEGDSPERTAQVARHLGQVAARALPSSKQGVRLLGPAPAPIARIKGKTRWQLLLKGPTHGALAGPLSALERALPDLPSSVKVVIDVDPGAML